MTVPDTLRLFFGPADLLEVRAMGVGPAGRTVGGYVRGCCPAGSLALHLSREYGKPQATDAVYFTPNPRTPPAAPLRPEPNAWTAATPPLTHDRDVPARRWLLLDIDRKKSSENKALSASDDEKAAAFGLAESAKKYMAGLGWSAPLAVDSGNGYHLYYRLAAPQPGGEVADPAADPLATLLRLLAARLDTPRANIDTKVFNSSRIMKLPDTMARKGPATADRPHRPCVVVSVPDGWDPLAADPGADVAAAVLALDPDGTRRETLRASAPAAAPAASYRPDDLPPLARRIDRAVKYLARIPGGVQGQHGSDPLYTAARAVVRGYLIGQATAVELLAEYYSPRCDPPWPVKDIEKKVRDAAARPFGKPDGWLLRKPDPAPVPLPDGDLTHLNPGGPTPTEGSGTPGDNGVSLSPPDAAGASGGPTTDDGRDLNEADDDPHRLARSVLARHRAGTRPGLVFWRDEFHAYTGRGYEVQPKGVFRARANAAVRRALVAAHKARLDHWRANKDNGDVAPVLIKTTGPLVANVTNALEGACLLAGVPELPAWLPGEAGPDPAELVSVANGLVHLPRYAAGEPGGLRPHTPGFFAPAGAVYLVDPDAPEPAEWHAFLADQWADDPASIGHLQEWLGYLLTTDTRQQKMLLMVGPPRCGKGTILNVATALVGQAATGATSLTALGESFGLQGLVGKRLATVGDARVDGRANLTVAAERLLSLSANDLLPVNRKGLPEVAVRLGCRVVLATNEVPRLPDASGALARRWSVLRFTKSFLDREDTTLFERRLVPELPGIFNWAVEGWRRLAARGRFLEAESAVEVRADLLAAGSPVAEFVADKCQVGDGHEVNTPALYRVWKDWCEANGRQHPGTAEQFGRQLRAYLPAVTRRQVREAGERIWRQVGIGLAPEGWARADDTTAGEPAAQAGGEPATLVQDL